ncbi:MAG: hypothetical protein K6E71_04860 [Lachnospiraceae bacterium]|nr:hypothetical protein [Lachnospiraceae bacterium]
MTCNKMLFMIAEIAYMIAVFTCAAERSTKLSVRSSRTFGNVSSRYTVIKQPPLTFLLRRQADNHHDYQ